MNRRKARSRVLSTAGTALQVAAFALGLALTGCGASQQTSEESGCPAYPILPEGSPRDFTRRGVVGDVRVANQEFCGDDAFIAMKRDSGRAPLQMGVNECEPEPVECAGIGAENVMTDAMDRLQAEGINAHTTGLGVCGDHMGNYNAWNYSVSVNRWQDVDRAVEIVAELMAEYEVYGKAGVSVRSQTCSVIRLPR